MRKVSTTTTTPRDIVDFWDTLCEHVNTYACYAFYISIVYILVYAGAKNRAGIKQHKQPTDLQIAKLVCASS